MSKLLPMRFICLLTVALCTACGGRTQLATFDDGITSNASAGGGASSHGVAPDAGAPEDAAAPADAAPPPDASCAWKFAPLVTYEAGEEPAAIAIADLDGDGHADLAVNTYGGGPDGMKLNILRNKGDGTFAPWRTYPSTVAFSIARGPFFAKTSADLLVGCDLFANRGGGAFAMPVMYSPSSVCGFQDSFNNLAVADFDGDGQVDFSWALLGNLVVYRNRGGGVFDEIDHTLNPVTPFMDTMTSADFDRDGHPDLAGVSWGYGYPNYLRIFHNTGNAEFTETDSDQGDLVPTVIAAGDLDSDGWPDLALVASAGLAVFINNGDGHFGIPATYDYGDDVRAMGIGDLNGDGASDVVFSGYQRHDVGVFFNHGGGTFAPAVHWPLPNGPWGMALGDLNGDGHLDIAVAGASSSDNGGVDVLLSRCE